MMKTAQKTELIVNLGSSSAAQQTVLDDLGAHGVHVLAYSVCPGRCGNALLFVSDDSDRAQHTLHDGGYDYRTDNVIFVEADLQPACAAYLGAHLQRQGIGVLYSYVMSTDDVNTLVVFKTTDNQRAVQVLAA